MRQFSAKGLQAFNLSLNQKANKVIVHRKRVTFARISLGALIVISLLQSFSTNNQTNITKSKLDQLFNAGTTTTILTIFSYISAMKIMSFQLIWYVLELPYISLAVTCIQMLVKYVYKYINGDFWTIAVAEMFELIDTHVTEAESPGFSTITTNVAGCFLSIFLLFLFGMSWGPVLSLLLWSSSMIVPNFMNNTMDVRQTIIMDLMQVRISN